MGTVRTLATVSTGALSVINYCQKKSLLNFGNR